MATVASYIAARAPGFVGDPRLTSFESQARLETGPVFARCGLGDKAVFLLMMHWFALDNRAGGLTNPAVGGTIRKEKEGGLLREYMLDFSLTQRYPDLSQTSWGMELIRLRKSCILMPRNRFTTVDD